MDKQFLNKKLMKALGDQASLSYRDKEKDLSYDQVTKKILKTVSWSEDLNLKETSEYLYLKTRYSDKLFYYYDQIIKAMSANDSVDLNSGEYADFWSLLDKLEIDQYFTEYKCKTLNASNLFNFLALFKGKLREEAFVNKFKLKSIEMIEYKKGLSNEVK